MEINDLNLCNGDIVTLNRRGSTRSWYSSMQLIFTRKPYTHSFLILDNILNEISVLSADEMTVIFPFKKYLKEDLVDFYIFSVNGLQYDQKEKILNEIYNEYAGGFFGFLQVPWFIYRWFNEVVLKRDVRKAKRRWLTGGVICSELVFYYIQKVANELNSQGLKSYLDQWNPNNVHVGDIMDICNHFPSIFTLKHEFTTPEKY